MPDARADEVIIFDLTTQRYWKREGQGTTGEKLLAGVYTRFQAEIHKQAMKNIKVLILEAVPEDNIEKLKARIKKLEFQLEKLLLTFE